MSKIVAVAAILGAVAIVIIGAWPKGEPAAASAVARGSISPFDPMVKHGKDLPVEDRRDMF